MGRSSKYTADDPYAPLTARIHHAFSRYFGTFGREVDEDVQRVRALSDSKWLTIPNIGARSVPVITAWLERYPT